MGQCDGCRQACYCSETCQLFHWTHGHSAQCNMDARLETMLNTAHSGVFVRPDITDPSFKAFIKAALGPVPLAISSVASSSVPSTTTTSAMIGSREDGTVDPTMLAYNSLENADDIDLSTNFLTTPVLPTSITPLEFVPQDPQFDILARLFPERCEILGFNVRDRPCDTHYAFVNVLKQSLAAYRDVSVQLGFYVSSKAERTNSLLETGFNVFDALRGDIRVFARLNDALEWSNPSENQIHTIMIVAFVLNNDFIAFERPLPGSTGVTVLRVINHQAVVPCGLVHLRINENRSKATFSKHYPHVIPPFDKELQQNCFQVIYQYETAAINTILKDDYDRRQNADPFNFKLIYPPTYNPLPYDRRGTDLLLDAVEIKSKLSDMNAMRTHQLFEEASPAANAAIFRTRLTFAVIQDYLVKHWSELTAFQEDYDVHPNIYKVLDMANRWRHLPVFDLNTAELKRRDPATHYAVNTSKAIPMPERRFIDAIPSPNPRLLPARVKPVPDNNAPKFDPQTPQRVPDARKKI